MTGDKCELCNKRLLDHKTAETLERINGILKEHELRLAKIDPGRGAWGRNEREELEYTYERYAVVVQTLREIKKCL